MSCGFDLGHYGEIVAAARAGGYRFAHFEGAPADGSVILRHDVDLSLDAAVRMAEVEHDAGASATYFLMTESVFYNLESSEGVAAIDRLRELGHRVALHAVYPNAPRDDRFDPVVAWHNPDPEYMRAPLADGRINVMQEPWFDPTTYRSDSNQHWRSGCPHDDLRAGRSRGCSSSRIRRSGRTRARRWARRCGRCWRPRRSGGCDSSPMTASICREACTGRRAEAGPRRR